MLKLPEKGSPAGQGEASRGDDHLEAVTEVIAEKKPTAQQRWVARNPLMHWCHTATNAAIRTGILVRKPCEECGTEKVDAHHPEHSSPLRVVWLCRRCHKAEHRRLRQGGAA